MVKACPGDEIYFDISYGNRCECVYWSAPGGSPSGQDGGCYFHTHWDTHGEKTVTVRTCSDSRQIKVWIGELCEGGKA